MTTLKGALLGGAAAMVATGAAAEELNLICSADVVICEKLVTEFEASHSDIDVNMVRLSSGEAYAKVRAEARNPQTDLWWGGTGDPHLQAAQDGLSAEYKSPMLEQLADWAQGQAETSGFKTVGVYSGALGWGFNKEIFEKKGIAAPQCWSDLLDPALKGEIQIADPNSSGTAYTALATLVQIMGEDEAFDFLKKMHANVSQYTKSGSAPVKAAARGETGLGIVFQHDAVTQCGRGLPDRGRLSLRGNGL
ncbi:extracellular solute-binding protein [Ponticoccus litoralis]|uniref:Extracellular solute-binding protein n=1 Tax=Ponticoccus litoralis TaxID=422297 RepID=A0AAW9SV80_9RHOB